MHLLFTLMPYSNFSSRLLGPGIRWIALCGLLALSACGGGGDEPGNGVSVVVPTLEMRSNVGGEASGPFTVTFDFSGEVSLTNGQLPFSTTNGGVVAGSFATVSASRYTVRIQPAANRQGLFELKVPPGAYRDASGAQSNTVTYVFSQPINTVAAAGPEASWSDSAATDWLLTGPVTVTLRFNEVLDAPLDPSRLAVSTGAISSFRKTSAAGDPDVYTFLYTPPGGAQGAVTIELPTGVVTAGGAPNSLVSWWTRAIRTP